MAQQQQSWFLEHPWMTFFLATGVINGIVYIARGPQRSDTSWLSQLRSNLTHPAPAPALAPPLTPSPTSHNVRGSYG